MARQQGSAAEQAGAVSLVPAMALAQPAGVLVLSSGAMAWPPEAQALRWLLLRRGNQEMWYAKIWF